MSVDAAPGRPTLRMPSVRFRREREQVWRELEALLTRVEKSGLGSLGPAGLSRLPVLYRAALSSLSVARAIALDAALIGYLEGLAAQAHVVLYGGRDPFPAALVRFWTRTFPGSVRRLRWHLAVAALLLALGTFTAWRQLDQDPGRFHEFVAPAYAQGRGPESSPAELRAVLERQESPRAEFVRFGSFLFTHNAGIGLASLGVGFAAGLPVVYLVLENGLLLGAFAWLHQRKGLGTAFWAWTLPHGVTEILALLICAAGGLMLGQALVFPGRWSRMQTLRRAGSEVGVVAVGSVAMFFLAGLIEGVFRQTVANPVLRWTVVATTAAGWLAYFTLAGRRR